MPITHATIPVPPAQVGADEWAEEHTLPTPAEIGAAATSHTHTRANITDWPILKVVKTATETVNNSVDYQADDELFINNVPVGLYEIRVSLRHRRYGTAVTGRARLVFSGTATFGIASDLDNAVAGDVNLGTFAAANGLRTGLYVGYLDVTATGNLTLEWAQNAAVATDLDLARGSYIVLQRLD